jgi:hypothetical protein
VPNALDKIKIRVVNVGSAGKVKNSKERISRGWIETRP